VALTAHALDRMSEKSGMDDILRKPVRLEELEAVLAKYCNGN
jgi:CheY-like chemotaxis protein